MTIASLTDLYVAELADLYDAETQTIRMLPRLAEAAHAPELRENLLRHADESRLHLERLQLIYTHLGQPRDTSRRCAGLAGIVQEGDERLNQPATPDARDAAIIGVAQRMEHYEIAGYGCARSYARRLNRGDESRLLQETLDDEVRADRRLSDIADAHVNDDARTEADLHQSAPQTDALRYMAARQLDYSRLTTGDLKIRNDDDDELGTFDGLLVEPASRTSRYIVVDAGGLFGGRHYLLPVGEVRFDPVGRVLRTPLDKSLAERYPAFDSDEFAAMDDAAAREYATRLLDLFPRKGTRSQSSGTGEPQPEWLLTGIWMTMPPGRADALTEEARTFANEFAPDREFPGSEAAPDRELAIAQEDASMAAARGATDRSSERADPQVPPAAHSTEPRTVNEGDAPTPPHGEKLRG